MDEPICWYKNRHELDPGMIFVCQGGIVQLDRRVPGDGTRWEVLDFFADGTWGAWGSEIEPSDLAGHPLANDPENLKEILKKEKNEN